MIFKERTYRDDFEATLGRIEVTISFFSLPFFLKKNRARRWKLRGQSLFSVLAKYATRFWTCDGEVSSPELSFFLRLVHDKRAAPHKPTTNSGGLSKKENMHRKNMQ